jgi:hypothetical protein
MVIVDFGQTAALQPTIKRGLIGFGINDPEQPVRIRTPALFAPLTQQGIGQYRTKFFDTRIGHMSMRVCFTQIINKRLEKFVSHFSVP